MYRFISTVAALLIGYVSVAQSLPVCTYDYGPTVHSLSGSFTFTTNTCPAGQPDATQVIPFPTGSPVVLDGWMNMAPGFSNLGPQDDQPNLYVVCGTDNQGFSTANFNTTLANDPILMGGLHVGWITPQGTQGNKLDIICPDGLVLKELWVTQGSIVNIYGPVTILEECHNAGVINIKEGGSLRFAVDRVKHQASMFENRGTLNGRYTYEAPYFTGPSVSSYGAIVDALPESISNTIDPIYANLDPLDWANYFNQNFAVFTENGVTSNYYDTYHLNGYAIKGLPVEGVRLNSFDGDFKTVATFKGFENNTGFSYEAGRIEDQGAGIDGSEGYVFMEVVDGDTLFYDITEAQIAEWTADTSLTNGGFFQTNAQRNFDDANEHIANVEAAPNLTWINIDDSDQPEFVGFYPGSFPNMLYWTDVRAHGSQGNPMYRGNYSIAQDTGSVQAFGLLTDPVTFQPPITDWAPDFAEFYPPGYASQPVEMPDGPTYQFSETVNPAYYNYAGLQMPDVNSPIHQPIGYWNFIAGFQKAPQIIAYEGYPWINAVGANSDPEYSAYPLTKGENHSLTVYDNFLENDIKITVPSSPSTNFVYNADGDLFSADVFDDCLLNESGDSLYCYSAVQDFEVYEIGYQTFEVDEFGNGEVLGAYQGIQQGNSWMLVSNPLNGYLDLDKVAARYFNMYPESQHIEFAWYNIGVNPVEASWIEDPYWLNLENQSLKRHWKSHYHLYGGEIYNDIDFWVLQLVEYASQFPDVQNELLAAFVDDYNDDGAINGEIAINYLSTSLLNPWAEGGLGRYMQPGSGFWIRNSSNETKDIYIGVDEGNYDFDLPQLVPGYEISGNNFLQGRTSQNDSALTTLMLAVDYYADTSYFPHVFFHHKWDEHYTNGTGHLEEHVSMNSFHPHVFGDSTNYNAYDWVGEKTPHNLSPLLATITRPDSAVMITPSVLQETSDTPELYEAWFDRIGVRVNSRAATIDFSDTEELTFEGGQGPIKYLMEGDSMWFRNRDYAYPVTLELFFTNMKGDVNGDGLVTTQDLIDFLPAYGYCAGDDPIIADYQDFDLNNDGCVTFLDHLYILSYMGYTLHADSSFTPVQINTLSFTESELLTNYSTDLELDAAVTTNGLEILSPGNTIVLHDASFNKVAEGVGRVYAPDAALYIATVEGNNVTPQLIGHIDLR